MQNKKLWFFLGLSFLEGASVMAAELLGAKMMAPYFGSSLYVWSAVMAVTLFGLAAGYFAGGILSEKPNKEKILYRSLVFAAVFTIAMPYVARFAFMLFGKMSLELAVTISSLLILFPPVFLMGTVSPLIISAISEKLNPGRASGTVYAVSTVGGILATFIYGFYIIPLAGLTLPALITGAVLGIVPLIKLIRHKDYLPNLILLGVFSFGIYKNTNVHAQGIIKVVYVSEGMLGQIVVLDYPKDYYSGDSTLKGNYSRWLFVNRISQTMDDPFAISEKGEEKYFTYVFRIEKALDTFKTGHKKVLLLGLGGGSVAKHLTQLGFQVDVCELDARMEYVARTYFGLPEKVNVTIDDARHFINTCEEKYDAIIFDTFKGEEAPSHVFTVESLKKVNEMLNDNGLIIVNTFGFIEGEEGKGTRSIFITLIESGFKTVAWPTGKNIYERNIEFLASKNSKINFNHPDFILPEETDLEDAVILTDEYPQFEIINARAALKWRTMAIDVFANDPSQKVIPVFE